MFAHRLPASQQQLFAADCLEQYAIPRFEEFYPNVSALRVVVRLRRLYATKEVTESFFQKAMERTRKIAIKLSGLANKFEDIKFSMASAMAKSTSYADPVDAINCSSMYIGDKIQQWRRAQEFYGHFIDSEK